MKKEIFIALIQKDIAELDMIAKGLNETGEIAPMVLHLATKKAQDLLTNLMQLTENQSKQAKIEEKTIEIIEKKPVEIEIVLNKEPEIEIKPEPEIKIELEPEPVKIPIQEEVKPLPPPLPPPSPSPEKKTTIADKMAVGAETKLDSISKSKENNSVASVISNKKITELKKSISLGDRFRFQRELFSGNVDLMTQTLTDLDAIENHNAALEYLHRKFQWDYETEVVSDFLNILNRRYL